MKRLIAIVLTATILAGCGKVDIPASAETVEEEKAEVIEKEYSFEKYDTITLRYNSSTDSISATYNYFAPERQEESYLVGKLGYATVALLYLCTTVNENAYSFSGLCGEISLFTSYNAKIGFKQISGTELDGTMVEESPRWMKEYINAPSDYEAGCEDIKQWIDESIADFTENLKEKGYME